MEAPVMYGTIEHPIVHFDDLDSMGMVYGSHHFTLVDRASADFWGRHGIQPSHPDALHVLREQSITYLAPIRDIGPLRVRLWIERIGRTSCTYGFEIRSGNGRILHAEGRRTTVRVSVATGRPAPWTAQAREGAKEILKPGASS
ncbi:thioesterase family protein [Actinoplanes sp. NBRC 103695]|uniref:acyl-CoA thioesterase n=1 Tax=Actinoplanes sp. NBRC 103695 TaxID=3032202 RepID=UPI00249FF809|nr:thioesterase family protein [Actinoplanes sp. NBRC 103695]GLZ00174.1 thioesterase [Actinoplanes sp. NBRC 103695]